jgi:hypothetical protein
MIAITGTSMEARLVKTTTCVKVSTKIYKSKICFGDRQNEYFVFDWKDREFLVKKKVWTQHNINNSCGEKNEPNDTSTNIIEILTKIVKDTAFLTPSISGVQ